MKERSLAWLLRHAGRQGGGRRADVLVRLRPQQQEGLASAGGTAGSKCETGAGADPHSIQEG